MSKQLILPSSVRRGITVDNADPSLMGGLTLDAATIDAAGAFLFGELERFDPRLYEPLVEFYWARDIDLRTDVTMGDEFSSFGKITYGANPGTSSGSRKSFIGANSTAIPTVSTDLNKTVAPLTPWGMTLDWSVFELARAQRVGRPIDIQKLTGMNLKWNMDIDEMVAVGDTGLGYPGMYNNSLVAASNVPNGAAGSPLWSLKTPDEILADVNAVLGAAWAASGFTITPRELRLPPLKFAYINSAKVSTAGNMSVLKYLEENSLSNANNGVPLRILPSKWLVGAGAAGTDRMVAYTKREDLIRFPMVALQRTPLQNVGIYQKVDYYGQLGVVEVVRPETLAYADGF